MSNLISILLPVLPNFTHQLLPFACIFGLLVLESDFNVHIIKLLSNFMQVQTGSIKGHQHNVDIHINGQLSMGALDLALTCCSCLANFHLYFEHSQSCWHIIFQLTFFILLLLSKSCFPCSQSLDKLRV